MYYCLDCDTIISKLKHHVEKCGLDIPPYREWDGCPKCGGVCSILYECASCGKYIVSDYIKLSNGDRYCFDCFTSYELGEEN